jgi:hypothetical protein
MVYEGYSCAHMSSYLSVSSPWQVEYRSGGTSHYIWWLPYGSALSNAGKSQQLRRASSTRLDPTHYITITSTSHRHPLQPLSLSQLSKHTHPNLVFLLHRHTTRIICRDSAILIHGRGSLHLQFLVTRQHSITNQHPAKLSTHKLHTSNPNHGRRLG